MIKLRSIVHFILAHRKIHLFNLFIMALVFLIPVLAFAEINLAIIDTGFCPSKEKKRNIVIDSVLDITNSVKLDCQKFDLNSLRYHGQNVLNEFLKFYNSKNQAIHIYPLIVFDKNGEQKKEYWLSAIKWIEKNKIDIVLTASGFINQEKIEMALPAIWFIPSGRITPQIKKETQLFPQNLAPLDNLFLIGDYYDGRQVLYDQGLLYQDKIDYYFPNGSGHFSGTSRAVAEACARALNLCPVKNMRPCLLRNKKEYIDNLSHHKISTY